MTARTQRQPFSNIQEFIANRRFTFEGVDYSHGDKFPWQDLDCPLRKLRQLWDGRFIDCVNTQFIEEDTSEKDTPAVEEDEGPFTFDPLLHKISNPKRGKWVIRENGVVVKQVDRRTADKLKRVRKPMEIE